MRSAKLPNAAIKTPRSFRYQFQNDSRSLTESLSARPKGQFSTHHKRFSCDLPHTLNKDAVENGTLFIRRAQPMDGKEKRP
jgi:hypothetical protein